MASIPMEEIEETRGGGKPPISAHPAFPAIVALWFAALLGLGSLILPGELIERIVAATGISSVIPAAAPPLGFTARAAIALAATILGALLGVVAARRVAGAHGTVPKRKKTKGSAGRMLNPAEDIAEEGIEPQLEDEFEESADFTEEADEAADERRSKRRRALAMAEDEGPSELLNAAPLPGSADGSMMADFSGFEDDAALELDEEIEFTGEFDPDVEPDFDSEPVPAPVVEAPRQEFIAPDSVTPDEAAEDEEPVPAEPFRFEDRSASNGHEPLAFSPPSMARVAGETAADGPRPFDAPGVSVPHAAEETVPEATAPEASAEAEAYDKAIFTPDTVDENHDTETQAPSQDIPMEFTPETPANSQDEHETGLVQLVQKLGNTLDKHREWSAARAAEKAAQPATPVAESGPAIPQAFEAARPDDAAEAMAAFFGSPDASPAVPEPAPDAQDQEPIAMPGAFDEPAERDTEDKVHPSNPLPMPGENYAPFAESMKLKPVDPADLDEEDEDEIADLAASFSLPISQANEAPAATPTPRPSFDIAPASSSAPTMEATEEEASQEPEPAPARDGNYGSLSAVSNPFKRESQEFVRIEEPEQDDAAAQPAVVFPNEQVRRAAPASQPENIAPAATNGRAFDAPPAAAAHQPVREPASNDDNERALREALMNLQRMGK